MSWQRYRKMLGFPTEPQQTQLLVDPISGLLPLPFPVSNPLGATSELFLRGTAGG